MRPQTPKRMERVGAIMSRLGSLIIKGKPLTKGYTRIIGPGEKGIRLLEFGRLLVSGEDWLGNTGDREVVIDLLRGTADLEVKSASGEERTFSRLGNRASAFDGLATDIYLPPGTSYRLRALNGPVEAAVYSAPSAERGGAVAVIRPEQNVVDVVGKHNWERRVISVVGDNVGTSRILSGETVCPPGNWAGTPPHKHDVATPQGEIPMEEIYFFQVKPSQGFGIIRIYSGTDDPEPLNEVYVLEDGDTVAVPKGYHQVAAGPGYTLHYTWGLAGEGRRYRAWSDDPRHSWLCKA